MTKEATFSFRLSPDDLTEIKTRAQQHEMSVSQYITLAALDRLDAEDVKWAHQVERRLSRLEQANFGS